MTVEIFLASKAKINWNGFREFLQCIANRRAVGAIRYETHGPDRDKKYLTRLAQELRMYRKTGNMEHLLNIAVYCYLESRAPENKRFHFDPSVGSATRETRR